VRRALILAAMAACGPGGDDDGGGPAIAGGGVSSGPIDGAVDVYVVEPGGETPIAGATVQVGALTAVTDADGLAAFVDPSLTGAQTISAAASGRTAATWFGVDGAAVTIPLDPLELPRARVTGTIAGWDDLETPDFDHYLLAVILYTFTEDIAAAENRLVQPTDGDGAPRNTCVRTAISNDCDWELVTRVGRQRLFAVIALGDTNGTTDDIGDDTYQLVGYASSPGLDLADGDQVSQTLEMLDAPVSDLSVDFPPAPGGLGNVVAIPTLGLGDDGRLVFPLPTLTPGNTTIPVPTPTGELDGDYDLVALATPDGAAVPYSTSFARDISLGGVSSFPAWLGTPVGLSASGRRVDFTAPDASSIDFATFTRSDGAVVWNVVVLDGASGFELPALDPDPLGGASLTVAVSSAVVPGFDPTDFRVLDLPGALERAAGAATTLLP
jgi:hypothetical protein